MRAGLPLNVYRQKTSTKDSNPVDKFSVAVKLDEQTIGHMPKEHSRLSWYFLTHGGQIGYRKKEVVHSW